jgi:hypothetical protein
MRKAVTTTTTVVVVMIVLLLGVTPGIYAAGDCCMPEATAMLGAAQRLWISSEQQAAG